MKTVKLFSIGACMALCMGFASCNEDEPKPEIDEYGISLTQEVDLGLPSGTIWAGWNVGASSPEQYGGFYAWGELEEKDDYTFANYTYYNDIDGNGKVDYKTEYEYLGENIGGTQYDVARQKWGSDWRMSTLEEFEELVENCSFTWMEYKGIKGSKVTGPNGKSIFLPAAGTYSNGYHNFNAKQGWYLSSSYDSEEHMICLLNFGDNHNDISHNVVRYVGATVRPVK